MKPVVAAMVSLSPDNVKRASRFRRMADVWERSAHDVFVGRATVICDRTPELDLTQPCPTFMRGKREIGPEKTLAWREKIRHWAAIAQKAPAGAPIVLCDIDMIWLGDPFPDLAELAPFDVAICRQCTGAVYLSGSAESHAFMEAWLEGTERLFENEKLYRTLDKKFLGLDQCSFQLTRRANINAKIASLPARFHSTAQWHDHPCYLFHIHGRPRGGALGYGKMAGIPPDLRRYCLAWQSVEAELHK